MTANKSKFDESKTKSKKGGSKGEGSLHEKRMNFLRGEEEKIIKQRIANQETTTDKLKIKNSMKL